jgi:hypothetical protein
MPLAKMHVKACFQACGLHLSHDDCVNGVFQAILLVRMQQLTL